MKQVRKALVGSIGGSSSRLALGALMVPLRSHLSIATAALVSSFPSWRAWSSAGSSGRPGECGRRLPGLRLRVSFGATTPWPPAGPQNWVALSVYVIVMLLVVASWPAWSRHGPKPGRAVETHGSSSSPSCLVDHRSVRICSRPSSIRSGSIFDVAGVRSSYLAGRLSILASAGEPLPEPELHQLDPTPAFPSASALPWDRRTPASLGAVGVGSPSGHTRPARNPGLWPRPGPVGHVCQPRRGGARTSPTTRAGPALGVARGDRPVEARADRRGVARPADAFGHDEGGRLDAPTIPPSRSPPPTWPSCTASSSRDRPSHPPGHQPSRHERYQAGVLHLHGARNGRRSRP